MPSQGTSRHIARSCDGYVAVMALLRRRPLTGSVIFGGTIGRAIGTLPAGVVFDRVGSHDLAFVILSVTAAPGLLLVVSLRSMKMKEQEV